MPTCSWGASLAWLPWNHGYRRTWMQEEVHCKKESMGDDTWHLVYEALYPNSLLRRMDPARLFQRKAMSGRASRRVSDTHTHKKTHTHISPACCGKEHRQVGTNPHYESSKTWSSKFYPVSGAHFWEAEADELGLKQTFQWRELQSFHQ